MLDASTPQPPWRLADAARRHWRALAAFGLMGAALCWLVLYAFVLNVDLSDAQRRLAREIEARERVENYLAETRAQLSAKLRELESLQARLDATTQDYDTLSTQKPGLPVAVDFRASYLGQGRVAEISNLSPRYLTVVLVARNPTLAQARRFQLELAPGAATAFGHLEGWRFASGDELALYHDDFAPLRASVP